MPPICSGDEPLTTGLKSGLETEFPACVLSRLLLRCLASRAKRSRSTVDPAMVKRRDGQT